MEYFPNKKLTDKKISHFVVCLQFDLVVGATRIGGIGKLSVDNVKSEGQNI